MNTNMDRYKVASAAGAVPCGYPAVGAAHIGCRTGGSPAQTRSGGGERYRPFFRSAKQRAGPWTAQQPTARHTGRCRELHRSSASEHRCFPSPTRRQTVLRQRAPAGSGSSPAEVRSDRDHRRRGGRPGACTLRRCGRPNGELRRAESARGGRVTDPARSPPSAETPRRRRSPPRATPRRPGTGDHLFPACVPAHRSGTEGFRKGRAP